MSNCNISTTTKILTPQPLYLLYNHTNIPFPQGLLYCSWPWPYLLDLHSQTQCACKLEVGCALMTALREDHPRICWKFLHVRSITLYVFYYITNQPLSTFLDFSLMAPPYPYVPISSSKCRRKIRVKRQAFEGNICNPSLDGWQPTIVFMKFKPAILW